MIHSSYQEILTGNQKLAPLVASQPELSISLLSNITVYQLKEILEYALRLNHLNPRLHFGGYDAIVRDSKTYQKSDVIIVFWETANLVEGLHYKAGLMTDKETDELIDRVKQELELVLMHTEDSPLVIMNKFSSLVFNYPHIKRNNLDRIAGELNDYLGRRAPGQLHLIELDKVIAQTSIAGSVDSRFFYSSKALYTIDFYKNYVRFICPLILSTRGIIKKALIFDCDNTLWHGIIGEDGLDGIDMHETGEKGRIFSEIQALALSLNKKGVILGLCSKNNPEEVEEVLVKHKDMKLKKEHLAITKTGWQDKAVFLQEIAAELNIGLDSLVYVDDSDFEVERVKTSLPQVTVLQVPKTLADYPRLLREHFYLFFNPAENETDSKKNRMYREERRRAETKAGFTSTEDYLASLKLKLKISLNDMTLVNRLSQLTQKTNQFNLTTTRYTVNEIAGWLRNPDSLVFAFEASDKFGNYGITGLAILKRNETTALVDTFLMSCRVIGRHLEYAFFQFLMTYLKKAGIQTVTADYRKTAKNNLVENFYDDVGLTAVEVTATKKTYLLDLAKDYNPDKRIDFIEVIHE